jgi:hypothetical protein
VESDILAFASAVLLILTVVRIALVDLRDVGEKWRAFLDAWRRPPNRGAPGAASEEDEVTGNERGAEQPVGEGEQAKQE